MLWLDCKHASFGISLVWIQRGDWISVLVAVADPCWATCRFLPSLSAQSEGFCKHRWRNCQTLTRLRHTREPFFPLVCLFFISVLHIAPPCKKKQPFIRMSRSWIVFHEWKTKGYRFVLEALCGGKIAHLSVAFSLVCNYLYRPITRSDKFLWFMTDTRTLQEHLSEYPAWVFELCLVSLKKMSQCNIFCF